MQWKKKKAGHYYSTQGMYSVIKNQTGVWFLYRAQIYIGYGYTLRDLKLRAERNWQRRTTNA